jgi:TetR/AcrR family transcriptional regulator, fatty acid metabolism regulator protein
MAEMVLKKEIIRKAAVKIFAKRGYYHCRISDIAKEARVAHGLIYHYFSSKEDVLLYIFRTAWTTLIDYVSKISIDAKDPVQSLNSIIAYMFKNFKNNPGLMRIMVMDIPRCDKFYNRENQELYNSFFAYLSNIIGEGQKCQAIRADISPTVASYMLLGIVDSIIRQYVYNNYFDSETFAIDDIINQATRVLMQGFCKQEQI